MTSATEKLRRLLDERGVEWSNCIGPFPQTAYNVGNVVWQVKELVAGLDVSTRYLTPEQAVEATLGRGTCHDEGDPSDFCCSECGARMYTNTNDTYTMIASDEHTIIKRPNYCPNCGREVVNDQ